jgi:hypothetical protein
MDGRSASRSSPCGRVAGRWSAQPATIADRTIRTPASRGDSRSGSSNPGPTARSPPRSLGRQPERWAFTPELPIPLGFPRSKQNCWSIRHKMKVEHLPQIQLLARAAAPNITGNRFRQLRATSGPSAAQQNGRYSITSSAVASSDGGTARSSALAVLLLTTSSNLVGCCTGSSPGFAPLSTRST